MSEAIIEPMKDKNGKILIMGNRVVGVKGDAHRLVNICGVTMLQDIKTQKTKVMRKVDLSQYEYSDA